MPTVLRVIGWEQLKAISLSYLGLRSCLGDQARISPQKNNYKGKVERTKTRKKGTALGLRNTIAPWSYGPPGGAWVGPSPVCLQGPSPSNTEAQRQDLVL